MKIQLEPLLSFHLHLVNAVTLLIRRRMPSEDFGSMLSVNPSFASEADNRALYKADIDSTGACPMQTGLACCKPSSVSSKICVRHIV